MESSDSTKLATLTLAIRLTQGWIFLSAGIRRFFSNTEKLNPFSNHYMAYKLNHALPGAVFDTDHVVSFILSHQALLQFFIVMFTTVEFVVGLALIVGFFTRAFAFISAFLAVSLMLIFGWLGSTCLDEWTMSSLNFSIGLVLMLSGGGFLSFDYLINKVYPQLGHVPWFQVFAGTHINDKHAIKYGIYFGIIGLAFSLFFYGYLFNGLTGPVQHSTNPSEYHIQLSDIEIEDNKSLVFQAYVDAGPDTQAAYIILIQLTNKEGKAIYEWTGDALSALGATNFNNEYKFSKFKVSSYGFMGVTGAKATIKLPFNLAENLKSGHYRLVLKSIGGQTWSKDFYW